jgi:hypothetical protein
MLHEAAQELLGGKARNASGFAQAWLTDVANRSRCVQVYSDLPRFPMPVQGHRHGTPRTMPPGRSGSIIDPIDINHLELPSVVKVKFDVNQGRF